MSEATRYPVPASRHRVEQVIERSRFICTLARVATPEEAQAFVREINAEFADATHNCWAYVAGAPGSTSRIGMSDAGEPHGTAGRPMLTVLLHGGVGEVAAVVTRYYGGVKLGTGGLVRAYGGAVQHALETLPRAERVEYAELTLAIGYPSVSAVQLLLPAHEAEVTDQKYGTDVRYRVRVPRPRLEALRDALMDATRGQAVIGDVTEPEG
jgi:uncharacterized YigZ family protein